MAQVPYSPFPSVQPTSPGEQVRVSPPGAAFGENIGAALQHLGGTVEQAGNELFTRAVAMKELDNQAEAREANLKFASQQTDLNEKLYSLEGKAAQDALPKFKEDTLALREQVRGNLSNPAVKREFDANAVGFVERSFIGAGRHVGAEFKKYVKGTAQANADMTAKAWADPTDESEVEQKVQTLRSSLDTLASDGSMSPEMKQDWMMKQVSHLRLMQSVELAKQGKMDAAFGILENHQKEFTQDDGIRATDQLRTQNRIMGSNFIANRVYGDGKSPAEMQKEAGPLIEKLSHGDPDFEEHVFTAIDHKYRRVNYESRMQKAVNVNQVDELIGSGKYHTAAELFAEHPDVVQALPQAVQNHLQARLNSYWNPINKQKNDENFDHLYGASFGTFDQRMQFLNTDPFSVQLSEGQRQRMISRQKELTKDPMDDPRTIDAQRAASEHFAPELAALGVLHAPTKGSAKEKDYLRWRGALQVGTEELTKSLGRPPTHDEIAEKVARPLIRKITEPGTFGMLLGGRDVAMFKQTIPDKVLESVKAEFTKEGMEPTDSDIVRAVQRKQFLDFFAKQKLKGELSGRPAPGSGSPSARPDAE